MFWLEEAGLPMTGANIARAMQLLPPTVRDCSPASSTTATSSATADKSLAFTGPGASTPATSSAATA